MINLDLLRFKDKLKTRISDGKPFVYDPIRKKWLALQPEELVRQLLVYFLIGEKGYPATRIGLEKGLKVNKLAKRCDILVYDRGMRPFLLAECKAPQVLIDKQTFWQIAVYNMPLRVPFILACNGPSAYCCRVDHQAESIEHLDALPEYPG
jgi:hypothetical protein